MFETWKIAKNPKSLITEDGIELTYCELGEEHEEIIISAAFYLHTWYPVLEELSKKYHVYGVIMRFGDGEGTKFNKDGSVHWSKQWGDDVYKFAKALHIEKFHYAGKCHGSVPGWYLAKNHPYMLKSFSSFFLTPHIMEQNSDEWHTDLAQQSLPIERLVRDVENGVKKKQAEMATLNEGPEGYGTTPPDWEYVIGGALNWDSKEECEAFLGDMDTPVCFLFGTDDILFNDWYDNNIKVMLTAKEARTIILQGERHLMELDCPRKIAREIQYFIDGVENGYN